MKPLEEKTQIMKRNSEVSSEALQRSKVKRGRGPSKGG